MKINIFYTLLLTIAVLSSCATEEIKLIEQTVTEDIFKNDKYQTTKTLLSTVKETSDKEQEVYLFSIAYNQSNQWLKSMSIIRKETLEPSLLVKLQGQYQVDCWVNGELLWSWSYDDKHSASVAILDCTDNYSGCSEICTIDARYFPLIKKED